MNKMRQIAVGCALLCIVWSTSVTCQAKGWITANVSVGGADIMVDENDGIPVRGKQICLPVEKGLHVVMIDKEGYHPYIDTITIQDGVNHHLQIWLKPATQETLKKTTLFKHEVWDYKVNNGFNKIRWIGVGAGLCTGLEFHLSLFNMRWGLFQFEPCVWGINVPFYNIYHFQTDWLVHPVDRRAESTEYELAIPSPSHQFYYTPMVGVYLPFCQQAAIVLSAGPQISWTKIDWSHQRREVITTSHFRYTEEAFPTSGYQFDPVWFSAQISLHYTGYRSDFLTYVKYQDGVFIGIEFRF